MTHFYKRGFIKRWQSSDSACINKGFRALFLEHFHRKRFKEIIALFHDLLHLPLVLDIDAFMIAIRSCCHHLPVNPSLYTLMMNTLRVYGPSYFVKDFYFTGLLQAIEQLGFMDLGKADPSGNVVCFNPIAYNMSKVDRFNLVYDDLLAILLHAGEFDKVVHGYLEKHSILEHLTTSTRFNPDRLLKLNKNPMVSLENTEASAANLIKAMVDKDAKRFDINPLAIDKDLESIARPNVKYRAVQQWLIFRHALCNFYASSNLVHAPQKDAPAPPCRADKPEGGVKEPGGGVKEPGGGVKELEMLERLQETWPLLKPHTHLLASYMERLSNVHFFGKAPRDHSICSPEAFMDCIEKRARLDGAEVAKFINAPLGETFLKARNDSGANSRANRIKELIASIRGCTRGERIWIGDIIKSMIQILRLGLDGVAGANLFFMILPWVRHIQWARFYVFACAFEADFERANVQALDALLDFMRYMDHEAEPALYGRFFGLCNTQMQYNYIFKHCRLLVAGGSVGSGAAILKGRVSFELHYNALVACKISGRSVYFILYARATAPGSAAPCFTIAPDAGPLQAHSLFNLDKSKASLGGFWALYSGRQIKCCTS
ncbi:hypothetical protein BdWA1_000957 [Babesia duncani]|uniref:Uncharacterized protein n=1 Tax=Babesia duncani TaxID=323732 RepID=A0AAD9PP54_9APIC|nr:hypothetical protein BdWA1_000957 [Babesia duncani]